MSGFCQMIDVLGLEYQTDKELFPCPHKILTRMVLLYYIQGFQDLYFNAVCIF